MSQWVKAGIVETRFEGDRVSKALEEAGIPYLIKSFMDTAYNGLYVPQKGWGAVLVPEESSEEGRRIISDVKNTFDKGTDDETEQPG